MEVFKASKDQSQVEEAFNFYAGKLNTKLILIIDQGFTKAHSSPILFEKSLKLLSTLCQFPIVDQLLTTPSDTPHLRLTRYMTKLTEILVASPSLSIVTLICEHLERIISGSQCKWTTVLIQTHLQNTFLSDNNLSSSVSLSLLNYGVMNGDRETCVKCIHMVVDML